jgi:hypothetical protein
MGIEWFFVKKDTNNKILKYEESDFLYKHITLKFLSTVKILCDEKTLFLIKEGGLITNKWSKHNYLRLDFFIYDNQKLNTISFEYANVQVDLFYRMSKRNLTSKLLSQLRLAFIIQNIVFKNSGKIGFYQYKYYHSLKYKLGLNFDDSIYSLIRYLHDFKFFPDLESIGFISRTNKFIRNNYMPKQYDFITNLNSIHILCIMNKNCTSDDLKLIEKIFKKFDYNLMNYSILDKQTTDVLAQTTRGGNYRFFGEPQSVLYLRSNKISRRSTEKKFINSLHPGLEDGLLLCIKSELREALDFNIHTTDNSSQTFEILNRIKSKINFL